MWARVRRCIACARARVQLQVAEILKGNRKYLGVSLAQGHVHVFLWLWFLWWALENPSCRERPNVNFQYSAKAEYRAECGMQDSAEAECRPNMSGLYSAEAEAEPF